jgi:hypothetical protein
MMKARALNFISTFKLLSLAGGLLVLEGITRAEVSDLPLT